jgi:hypothetical protein
MPTMATRAPSVRCRIEGIYGFSTREQACFGRTMDPRSRSGSRAGRASRLVIAKSG